MKVFQKFLWLKISYLLKPTQHAGFSSLSLLKHILFWKNLHSKTTSSLAQTQSQLSLLAYLLTQAVTLCYNHYSRKTSPLRGQCAVFAVHVLFLFSNNYLDSEIVRNVAKFLYLKYLQIPQTSQFPNFFFHIDNTLESLQLLIFIIGWTLPLSYTFTSLYFIISLILHMCVFLFLSLYSLS